MPKTYEPIGTQTGNGSASTITFSSIPSAYTDLVLVTNILTTANANQSIRINGDTGSNYSTTSLYGTGASAFSGRTSNNTALTFQSEAFSTSTVSLLSVLHFMNYANTSTYKTIISRTSQANRAAEANVNLWRSTSAITSISIQGATFTSDAVFTLYGIKAT
jgi:hypothetical protein